jgi:hypothetical protein
MPKMLRRFDRLTAVKTWLPGSGNGNGGSSSGAPPAFMDVERIFGENTFGLAQMRSRLPKPIYQALLATI